MCALVTEPDGTARVRAFARKLGVVALADGVRTGEGRAMAEAWAATQNAGHLHRHDADRWRSLAASERQLGLLPASGRAAPGARPHTRTGE